MPKKKTAATKREPKLIELEILDAADFPNRAAVAGFAKSERLQQILGVIAATLSPGEGADDELLRRARGAASCLMVDVLMLLRAGADGGPVLVRNEDSGSGFNADRAADLAALALAARCDEKNAGAALMFSLLERSRKRRDESRKLGSQMADEVAQLTPVEFYRRAAGEAA